MINCSVCIYVYECVCVYKISICTKHHENALKSPLTFFFVKQFTNVDLVREKEGTCQRFMSAAASSWVSW